jgi:uncharacterized phiE125 gp8 family phage protein
MNLERIVQPAALPLDIAAARSQVRQDVSIDDADLDAYMRAARRFAETGCNRTLIATRYRLTLDEFPDDVLKLEFGPVLKVVSITYVDAAGDWQTVDSAVYVVDLGSVTRIALATGQSWPTADSRIGAVRVTYDAGDAAAVTVVAGTDVLTIKGGLWSTLAVNDVVRLSNSGGVLPSPFSPDTDYYIQSVPSTTTFKLSETADGAAIDITDAGTGTHYIGAVPEDVLSWMRLRIGGLYENREDAVVAQGQQMITLPYVDRLLDGAKLY